MGVTDQSVRVSGRRDHRIAEGSALAAAAIGAVGLAGWLAGVAGLARWTDASMAMAPMAAIALALLGAAVFLHTRWPAQRAARRTAAIVAIAIAGLSLLGLAQFVAGFNLGLERPLVRSGESVLGAAAAQVSPLAALALLLGAASLIDRLAFPLRADAGRNTATVLGVGVVAIALTTLAGYALGGPLLSGSAVRPVALPTASGLALLGAALVAAARAPAGLDAGASAGPVFMRSARMRYVPIALAAAGGLALSGALATIVSRLDEARRREDFARLTERAAAALRFTIARDIDPVLDIRDLFITRQEVRRDEFRAFAQASLAHGATVDVLGWAPRVTDAERPAFEAAAAREGRRGFRIVELDARDTVVPAARRAEYYPILFLGVPHGVSGAIRFDLGSEPKRRETLDRARESADLAATVPVAVRRPGHSPSILVVSAVYRGSATPGTAAARRDRLAGFAFGALGAAGLVANARRLAPSTDAALRLADVSDPAHPITIYADPAFSAQDSAIAPVSIPIALADRTWMAEFRPTALYLTTQRRWDAWLVFGSGLLLTLLIAAHLYSLERYSADIEAAHRLVAESEGRFRAIAESAADGIITIDATGTIVHCNAAAGREFGYEDGGLLGRNVRDLVPPSYVAPHSAGLSRYGATGATLIVGEPLELPALHRDGSEFPVELSLAVWETHEGRFATAILRDITERKSAREERERLIAELQDALANVKTLHGLVPVCAWCRKVLDDRGAWRQMEAYVSEHTDAEFSHGMCPDCEKKFRDSED